MKACMIKSVLLLAAAVVFAGCASNQQFVRFPDQGKRLEDPAKGRIYVIRPSVMGSAASLEVWDGNLHVGNTGANSFLCWERKPGQAQVSGKEENVSTVELNVEANQVYYIFQHMRMGWVQARNKLEVITEEEGQKRLKGCKPPKPGQCSDHAECRAATPQ
jgi:hypothetical protein